MKTFIRRIRLIGLIRPILLFGLIRPILGASPGDNILVLTGTNTTTDWTLQQVLQWTLSASSTNTHSNVPTSATKRQQMSMLVTGNGTRTLDFVFLGGITTNWITGFSRTPRSGQTLYLFSQYGSTVYISQQSPVDLSNGSTGGTSSPTNVVVSLTIPAASGGVFFDNDTTGTNGTISSSILISSTNLTVTGNITVNSITSTNGYNGPMSFVYPVAASDETTALTAGTAKVTFRMPFACTLTAVRASLTTAQASGSIFTVDINEAGLTILSTKITIDNTEKTSVTAVTPPVISDTAIADDAEMTIDIDQVGNGTAAGLKVELYGTNP